MLPHNHLFCSLRVQLWSGYRKQQLGYTYYLETDSRHVQFDTLLHTHRLMRSFNSMKIDASKGSDVVHDKIDGIVAFGDQPIAVNDMRPLKTCLIETLLPYEMFDTITSTPAVRAESNENKTDLRAVFNVHQELCDNDPDYKAMFKKVDMTLFKRQLGKHNFFVKLKAPQPSLASWSAKLQSHVQRTHFKGRSNLAFA